MSQIAVTLITEPRLRTLCTVTLRHLGFRVREAGHGSEVTAFLAAEPTRLVIAGSDVPELHIIREACTNHPARFLAISPDEKIATLLELIEEPQKSG
jgi:hypothetical protein